MCYLGHLSAALESAASAAPARGAELDDLVSVRRVRDRIDRECAGRIDVAVLTGELDLAPGQLNRRFEIAYGMSPYEYLAARRVERAARADVCSDSQEGQTDHGSQHGLEGVLAAGGRHP